MVLKFSLSHPTPHSLLPIPYFALQTLHNRKFPKKKLGEVPLSSFCIFFTWEICILKEVIGIEIYILKEVTNMYVERGNKYIC
jgi:hypothetical protein